MSKVILHFYLRYQENKCLLCLSVCVRCLTLIIIIISFSPTTFLYHAHIFTILDETSLKRDDRQWQTWGQTAEIPDKITLMAGCQIMSNSMNSRHQKPDFLVLGWSWNYCLHLCVSSVVEI